MEMIEHVDTLAQDTLILLTIFGLTSAAAYCMDIALKDYERRREIIQRRLRDSIRRD